MTKANDNDDDNLKNDDDSDGNDNSNYDNRIDDNGTDDNKNDNSRNDDVVEDPVVQPEWWVRTAQMLHKLHSKYPVQTPGLQTTTTTRL